MLPRFMSTLPVLRICCRKRQGIPKSSLRVRHARVHGFVRAGAAYSELRSQHHRWGAVSSAIQDRAEEGLPVMNFKVLFVSSALALAVAGCMTPMGSAPAPAPIAVTSAAEFVPTATSSNLFEIESSRLALQRSRDPEVRRFAQQMIRDHN